MMTYLKLCFTAFFWGGTFIAGRAISTSVDPFSAAFLRFAIASIFLSLFVWRVHGRIPSIELAQLVPVILLGLTGVFAYNAFFFKGLQRIEAGRAAVIIATNPVLIALFSALIFKERLTWTKITGILLSVSGAVIVITRGNPIQLWHGGLGWGEVFIFGCVLSWVSFSLIGKRVMNHLSPLMSVFYSTVAGTLMLFLPAVVEGLFNQTYTYDVVDWFSLFYLGFFGTVLGFVWYYQGINTIGPTRASLFINLVPVSAVILAFLILDEPLTRSLLVGTLLVSTGMYLTNRPV